MPSRYETDTINLALSILKAALPLNERKERGTPAMRLALRIVYPEIDPKHAARDFWEEASSPIPHPWMSGHRPYDAIVHLLKEAGWEVAPENEGY